METSRQKCLQGAAGKQGSNVLTNQEVEWLAEDSHAPDLANQEMSVNMECSRSIKTAEDISLANGDGHVVQQFTPVPQTEEFIKTELILDEEIRDDMNDSKAHCKQNVLAQADELDSNSCSSTQHILAPVLAQRAKACITDNESETSEISSHGNSRSRGPFACELCARTFRDRSSLRNHLSTHATNRKREITCDLCGSKFYYERSLKRHKKLYCNKNMVSTFICKMCGSPFARKGNLKIHMLTEHLDKSQSITPAPQTVDDQSINTIQILKDRQTEGRRFECKICSRSLKTEKYLRLHLRTHSKDRKRDFACDLCGKTFYCKRILWSHRKVHAPDEFHCKVCGKSYKLKQSLKKHMLLRQHFDETQQFTPRASNDAGVPMKNELISDEEFIEEGNERDSDANAEGHQHSAPGTDDEQHARVSESSFLQNANQSLDMPTKSMEKTQQITLGAQTADDDFISPDHISKTIWPEEATFECEFCSRTFRRRWYLENHLNTHTTDRKREFVCDICERPFYNKKDMITHKKRYAQKDHPKFKCDVCCSSFTRKRDLDEHMITKHLEEAESITPVPQTPDHNSINANQADGARFECGICSCNFKERHHLQWHLTSHAEDRKSEFSCDVCKKTFSNKHSLRNHEHVHTENGIKPFICEVCGSSFAQRRYLKMHRLRKHLDETQPITAAPQTVDDQSINTNQIRKDCQTEGRRFECEICSRSLKNKRLLRLHLHTHSKDRNRDFACDLCESKFFNKRSLWYHKKVHALNVYRCKVCGKGFKLEQNLKVHVLLRRHFHETQQSTPQPSNDAGVPIKTELISDEEFIDESNGKESVSHGAESQEHALAADYEQPFGEDSVSCEATRQH